MIKGDSSIKSFSDRLKEKKRKGLCMSLVGATSMSLIFFLDLSLSEAWDKCDTSSKFSFIKT